MIQTVFSTSYNEYMTRYFCSGTITRDHVAKATTIFLALVCLGCQESIPPAAQDPDPEWIVSDDAITADNGNVTIGHPALTEDVEREIYRSLGHRRKMIKSIGNGSGSKRGIQQMQDELNLLTRGFMSRYNLTRTEIDSILEKGDANDWK